MTASDETERWIDDALRKDAPPVKTTWDPATSNPLEDVRAMIDYYREHPEVPGNVDPYLQLTRGGAGWGKTTAMEQLAKSLCELGEHVHLAYPGKRLVCHFNPVCPGLEPPA